MKRLLFRLHLFPALTPNGELVHLANRFGQTACGSSRYASLRVPGRITCRRCAEKMPRHARRHTRKPIVVGLDWNAHYDALGDALRAGATKMPRNIPGPTPVVRKHLPKRYPWRSR